MSDMSPIRGGSPVAHLDDFDALDTASIACLRNGPFANERALGQVLGARPGSAPLTGLLRAVNDLFAICASHSRRPLARHHPACRAVGSDEAFWAQFIRTCATGGREDALMMAMLLVRADIAPLVTSLAQQVGLGLRRQRLDQSPRSRYLQ